MVAARLNLGVPTAGMSASGAESWLNPRQYWPDLTAASAALSAPLAVLHLGALRHNLADMRRRANGVPIRVASKSVRVRSVIEATLREPGFSGVLAYTLAEALWLARTIDDVVVGYPSLDRGAIATLAASPKLSARVTLMVDSLEHLDFIDSVVPPGARNRIRLCLELDASWNAPGLGHLGVWRSPVHEPADAEALAAAIVARPGFQLVGMMAYEAQIAGVGDRPAGKPIDGAINRWMQAKSLLELHERRADAVARVRRIAELEFVNGGGTGSLESTASDRSVTEIGAGSGLLGGHLFDNYSSFAPAPAAAFALDVVRRPAAHTVTILGGGWIASGPPAPDRLPRVVWPEGLTMLPREAAGEVQTPLRGAQAGRMRLGERVWLRHTKSGELAEHVNEFAVIDGDEHVDTVPSYRGEGKAFL